MNHNHRSIFLTILIWVVYSCTAQQPITIMTAPIGKTSYGHRQVTESLLRGLAQLGVPFVYNPTSLNQVTDIVVALADPATVRQGIELKKKGRIKYLLAGPNIMERSNEHGGILGSDEIDACIVPSQWVATAYEEDMPSLKGRIIQWYAGVDTDHWSPALNDRTSMTDKTVLIYWKTESECFIESVESVVKQHGFKPLRLRYGTYTAEQYKAALNQVSAAIFISRSESQGIALAEAWSMNVPTLVWNPQELIRNGRVYSEVSAAPYLTVSTGCMWKELQELKDILNSLHHYQFSPRQWVMENMTHQASARLLLDYIKNICALAH